MLNFVRGFIFYRENETVVQFNCISNLFQFQKTFTKNNKLLKLFQL